MSRLIDVDAFICEIRKIYCERCDRRKGFKNGKMRFCYEIGGVPCRACDIEDMLDALDDFVPTVQPELTWTHVSEKLPEEEVDVLCVTHAGAMFVASYGQLYFDPNEKGWITTEFNRFCTGTVYAWTDLPEKPKGVTI